ncbi:366_t:CDS:2 [Acaulospora colombiana]|uniref:366_t:CDS:1 n=1 Tax=Acaulospora colombiana TaxID=27376 RepID=A0ACA9LGH7_9GLOM|nr:366_t:CDS:2 [Acaulospora colombiana]
MFSEKEGWYVSTLRNTEICCNKIIETHNTFKTVVDFYADWCGPCRMMAPKIEEFSKVFPEVKFIKVNTDEQTELSREYSISSLPTFYIFVNGKRDESLDVIGAREGMLRENIQKALDKIKQ